MTKFLVCSIENIIFSIPRIPCMGPYLNTSFWLFVLLYVFSFFHLSTFPCFWSTNADNWSCPTIIVCFVPLLVIKTFQKQCLKGKLLHHVEFGMFHSSHQAKNEDSCISEMFLLYVKKILTLVNAICCKFQQDSSHWCQIPFKHM